MRVLSPHRLAVGTSLMAIFSACTVPPESSENMGAPSQSQQAVQPVCRGESIEICDFPGEHDLETAIGLVLKNVEDAVVRKNLTKEELAGAHAACAAVAYPGSEKAVLAETAKRGTFICLFNSQYVMNMALNRLSTFIEDFETVDASPDYTDAGWTKDQATNGSLGHNLESPDLKRYLAETASHIARRNLSQDPGIKLEAAFLNQFIIPKIDDVKGKSQSIILGVPLPDPHGPREPMAELKAVLGHEIFHALYFHSARLRALVQNYIDATSPSDVALMKWRLSQKGYAVTNDDGSPPSEKQVYMFYNEAQAYLLESGACTDGAFMSYEDADSPEPTRVIEKTAPLVVRHAGKLRSAMVQEGIMTSPWAATWSPDLVRTQGCRER